MRNATKLLVKSIKMLRELHSIGIVHGDFHYGNIAFRKSTTMSADACTDSAASLLDSLAARRKPAMTTTPDDDDLDLVFIDFGSSKFFSSTVVESGPGGDWLRYYFMEPTLLSLFQLSGSPIGPRDDIYRAVEAFANVVSRNKLSELFDLALKLDENDGDLTAKPQRL